VYVRYSTEARYSLTAFGRHKLVGSTLESEEMEYLTGGMVLEAINPAVANTVTELLLLSVQNVLQP
jgi:hypothetical protein